VLVNPNHLLLIGLMEERIATSLDFSNLIKKITSSGYKYRSEKPRG